ncbi:tyrosine-type recombinase/integrase [Parasphingorhabdus sp.]|uniref:tyrosine-type recombinase/integrase n=1 Tax=Parasphingorhabdus sp. TaxID=2709688 RepID=UPI003A8D8657
MPGTVEWLFQWYRGLDKYKKLSHKTKTDYRGIMDRLVVEPMKVGMFGQRRAGAVTSIAADAIYKRWTERHGKRQGSYAMQVCRLVWNQAKRPGYDKITGVSDNPFAGMGISSTAEHGNRETSREEYDLYRQTAREMGFQSMATAAALSFELVQRVWDVFGFVDPTGQKTRGLVWADYMPAESFRIRQSKTAKPIEIPLTAEIDGEIVSLYPDLEAELDRTDRKGLLIVLEERNGLPYTTRRMSDIHRKICEKAGLPKDMTFTGFRHGGATELGDAGVEDMRAITGHDHVGTTRIYNKANIRKARKIGLQRRKHLERKS